jgi:beta-glucosidase
VAAAVRTVDGIQNRLWLDAVLTGRYPDDVLEVLAPALQEVILDDDLAVISTPVDIIGVNYYNDHYVDVDGPAARSMADQYAVPERFTAYDPAPNQTGMGWPITPFGLTQILLRIGSEYPQAPPLAVTENGSAFPDGEPDRDGSVLADPERVAYLHSHLEAVSTAVHKGADVRAYFAWSLLDNFEWAWGYSQRFGIVHVDFETLQRRPKGSYEAYREHIAAVKQAQ